MKNEKSFARQVMILLVLLLAGLPTSGGTRYYIDSVKGSDSRSGLSERQAWKTTLPVTHLHLVPGDTLLFAAGSHFGRIGNQGFRHRRITDRAYPVWKGESPPFYQSRP